MGAWELELLLPLLLLLPSWPLSFPGLGSSLLLPALEVSGVVVAGHLLLLRWGMLALMLMLMLILELLQPRRVLVHLHRLPWAVAKVSGPLLVVSWSQAVCSESLAIVVVLIISPPTSSALVAAVRRPEAVLGGGAGTPALAKVHLRFPPTAAKWSWP